MKTIITIIALTLSSFLYADSIAHKLSESAKKHPCVVLVMSQDKIMTIFSEPVSGDAVIAADSKGNIRFQVLSPYESILISNERGVFQFEKTPDGWKKLNVSSYSDKMKKVIEEIRKLILGDYSDETFKSVETDGKIFLTPRKSALKMFIDQIVITPREDFFCPKTIEIIDADKDKTVLKIKNVIVNPSNIESAFDENDKLKFSASQK